MEAANPLADKTSPFLEGLKEAVKKLKGRAASGICRISKEMLKAVCEAMIQELHAVLSLFGNLVPFILTEKWNRLPLSGIK